MNLRSFFQQVTRKRWQRWLLGVGAILVAVLAVVFNPAFQRWVVLGQLQKQFPEASVQRLAVGPFSTELVALKIPSADWQISLASVQVRYSLWGLLRRHLVVRELTVDGLKIHVYETGEPIPEAEVSDQPLLLPGVWQLTDLGWRVTLDQVNLELQIATPQAILGLEVSGVDLAPGERGRFDLQPLRLAIVDTNPDVPMGREVVVEGQLRLEESERGAFTALAWDLVMDVQGEWIEQPPRLSVSGHWSADPDWAQAAKSPEAETPYPSESFALEIRKLEDPTLSGDTSSATVLSAEGNYDAPGQTVDATFSFDARKRSLDAFSWALNLPEFDGQGFGELAWDLAAMSGHASTSLSLLISELGQLSPALEGVTPLHLKTDFQFHADTKIVTLEKLDFSLSEAGGDSVVAFQTKHPLTFFLAAPKAGDEAGFERPWLALQVGFPLEWLTIPVTGLDVSDGVLRGVLQFEGSPLEILTITSPAPLNLENATLTLDGQPLLKAVAVSLIPHLEVDTRAAKARFEVADLQVNVDGERWLDSTAGGAIELLPEFLAKVKVKTDVELTSGLHQRLATLLDTTEVNEGHRLLTAIQTLGPATLALATEASINLKGATLHHLQAKLSDPDQSNLISAQLLQEVTVHMTDEEFQFEGLEGQWLKIASANFPLRAIAVLVEGVDLDGDAIRGAWTVGSSDVPGGFILNSTEPLQIERLSVAQGEVVLLETMDLSLLTALSYQPGQLNIQVEDFRASQEGESVIRGALTAQATLKANQLDTVTFTIDGGAAIPPLFRQPLLRELLHNSWEYPVEAALSFAGTTDLSSLTLSSGSMTLGEANQPPYASLELDRPLSVDRLSDDIQEVLRTATRGSGTFSLRQFPLRLPLALVDPGDLQLTEGEMSTVLAWEHNPQESSIRTQKPFSLDGLSIQREGQPWLEKITASAEPALHFAPATQVLKLDLATIRLTSGSAAPLVGAASATIAQDPELRLPAASMEISGELAPWMAQPAMPPNQVSSGQFSLVFSLDQEGSQANVEGTLRELGFGGAEPTLTSATLNASATRTPETLDWPGTASLRLSSAGGESDLDSDFTWLTRQPIPRLVMETTGQRLYLGDLIQIAQAWSPGGDPAAPTALPDPAVEVAALPDTEPANGDEEWEEPPSSLDFDQIARETRTDEAIEPDTEPFWAGLPAELNLTLALDRVIYSPYLSFTDISAEVEANASQVQMKHFESHFYEAVIAAQGGLAWDQNTPQEPYQLQANFDVRDFDLNAFFSEWVPGEKARIEGLFRMAVTTEGQFPKLDAARNHLRLDFDLESTNGVFRAIPPNSPLAQNASNAAATIGTAISWLPTGGLGLGALSRLVTAMREIPYQRVALRIVRNTDLNVRIEEMEVKSPEILLLGQGGILYDQELDLLEQRLDLTASMAARGNMAAILSALSLLQSERMENGYWEGFTFRIWGSLEDSKSNFPQIVTEASTGTLTRNLSNPFHGIWSNIKFQGTEAKVE